ncbi:MAG: hypothetical protein KDA78_08625, partial [Planctomycetaceae bacterium]|nr:hypothetical protein [Planctomycetaceae bacterium]
DDDFIFDDFESGDNHKQILTASELSHQIEVLENQEEPEATSSSRIENQDLNDWSESILAPEPVSGSSQIPISPAPRQDLPRKPSRPTAFREEAIPTFSELNAAEIDYSQVRDYANRAANAQNRFDRASYLGRLTWELIAVGEYAWAYHVSRCLYINTDKELTLPAPPPWLIALLVMSDNVRLSSGRIAREFETLADEHREEAKKISEDPESPEAFLLRASMIRGAITTASVSAVDILRSFSIVPSQTQLYNYCSRVASFAARSSGLRLDQYFYRPGAASIEADTRAIRTRVIAWRPEAYHDILSYDVATPLFSRAYWSVHTPAAARRPELIREWRTRQVLQAHITRMLQAIIDGQYNKSQLVEAEIRKLSQSVILNNGNTQTILSEHETVTIPGRELYNHVQEAIEFASHWLVLAASYPGIESVLVPQEINELRDEIDRRQHSVFVEMTQIERQHGHHAHRSALTACRRSMDRISQLFHPREEPRISEQDPLCLLNAVLLKIPGATLEDDWSCKISPTTLEHQVLLTLQKGHVSWQDAFEQQLSAGSYRAGRSLLKVDAWTQRERQWMTAQLEAKRQDSAASLAALVSQIKGKIHESRQLEVINSLEAARLMKQVDGLEGRITTEYQLDQLRNELNQLWQLMESRREQELKKMQEKLSRLQKQLRGEPTSIPEGSEQLEIEDLVDQLPDQPDDISSPGDQDDWAIDV